MSGLQPVEHGPERRRPRASVLLVGEDVRIRALGAQLRRLGSGVREAKLVVEALAIVGEATAREPVAAVVVCVRTRDFDIAQVVAAFDRVEAALPVYVATSPDEHRLEPELIANGFEDTLQLPASDAELWRLLDDLGLMPPSSAAPTGRAMPSVGESQAPAALVPPMPKDVVELKVERAQERATREPATPSAEPPSAGKRAAPAEHPARPTTPDAPARLATPATPVPATLQANLESNLESNLGANLSDADLADALATGAPIEPLAIAIIRIQLRSEDVRFASSARPAEREAIARERARRGRHAAEVRLTHADGTTTVFGDLLSESVSAERLAPWAAWLASWLRLEERVSDLARLATTDELTGAGNRRAFHEAFDAARTRARATRRTVSLMYFDLDDFKRYNDQHGHDIGDEVLRETVELLRQTIRKGDLIFRFGGDEFVILFANGARGPNETGDAPESIQALFDRFRRALKELALPQLGARGAGPITVSGGVSVFPWDASSADELLRLAEERARQSKAEGKDIITFGPPLEDLDSDQEPDGHSDDGDSSDGVGGASIH
jgi:diguanylate cyclase (GGDEF)-like protein